MGKARRGRRAAWCGFPLAVSHPDAKTRIGGGRRAQWKHLVSCKAVTPRNGLRSAKGWPTTPRTVNARGPSLTLRAAVFCCSAKSRWTASLAIATSCGSADSPSSPPASTGSSSLSGSAPSLCTWWWDFSRSQLWPGQRGQGASSAQGRDSCTSVLEPLWLPLALHRCRCKGQPDDLSCICVPQPTRNRPRHLLKKRAPLSLCLLVVKLG
jgi:hypothetical protein